MDCNPSDTPKTELQIEVLLESHESCPIKGHILVVTDKKQVLLKHSKELLCSDVVIAKLNNKHIHTGLTAKQWNNFSQTINNVIKKTIPAFLILLFFNNS
ncbi:MAG: hypothetical protein JXA96_13240 [Sedimentisphaerales bacterium]|nr:hypothetical protein [Sedimentisphaerales bacterium]